MHPPEHNFIGKLKCKHKKKKKKKSSKGRDLLCKSTMDAATNYALDLVLLVRAYHQKQFEYANALFDLNLIHAEGVGCLRTCPSKLRASTSWTRWRSWR